MCVMFLFVAASFTTIQECNYPYFLLIRSHFYKHYSNWTG